MIFLLAVGVLHLSPVLQGEGYDARNPQEPVERLDLAGATAQELEERLGLVALEPVTPSGPAVALLGSTGPGGFELEITNTGTGFAEKFVLQLPATPSKASPSPLLVAFHKYGSSADDIVKNTDFDDECWQRNWFLVAPLGASQKSFSSLESQRNTELVLELVVARLGSYIDRSRIYAAGFSMGGSNAMNYAARHVDPTRPMFAAIVNHTGPSSLAHSYTIETNVQPILEFWFGGSPADVPFAYARSSVIDAYEVDTVPATAASGAGMSAGGGTLPGGDGGVSGPALPPIVLAVRPESSLAQNLTHVPFYFVRGKFDPLSHITAQMEATELFLENLGAHVDFVVVPNVFLHKWNTLDEDAALDWLAQFRLTLPTRGTTLADRDDRYFHFEVEQDSPGAFTPFTWEIDLDLNAFRVVETANLARLTFFLDGTRLDTSRELGAALGTADGARDEIRLVGLAKHPRMVLRDGLPSSDFAWEARTGVLVLFESGVGIHDWRILPAR